MTETYTWVVEQEINKRSGKTEKWVHEQQTFLSVDYRDKFDVENVSVVRRKLWDEMAYNYELEAERWMRQEEESRRLALEREKTKARIQDELRRIEVKFHLRREAERRRLAEERAKVYAEVREQERMERIRSDRATIEGWKLYDEKWAALATSTEPLTFDLIPWPLTSAPRGFEDIKPAAITKFLFSPLHSHSLTRKDRIRSAQLRWHPDRFRRLMNRVPDDEKLAVEEGVGIVARCLNDLMAQEKCAARAVYQTS